MVGEIIIILNHLSVTILKKKIQLKEGRLTKAWLNETIILIIKVNTSQYYRHDIRVQESMRLRSVRITHQSIVPKMVY